MGPFDLFKMYQMEQAMEQMRQKQQQQPSFSAGMPDFASPGSGPSMADQIPGMMPQRQAQPDTTMDMLRRRFMSGGAGDLRNLGMALGMGGQAAGGMGQAAMMANRAGMPGKGIEPVDQMFNMRGQAPLMGGGAAGLMPGEQGGMPGQANPLVDLIAAIMRRRGQGMNFPNATGGSPQGMMRGVLPQV